MARICHVFSSNSPRGACDPISSAAMERYGSYEAIDHAGADSGYYDCLAELWKTTRNEDLVIVEHDIVIRQDTIKNLLECTEGDYCSWDYPIGSGPTRGAGLGCVRFKKRLIIEVPGLFSDLLAINWPHSGNNTSWTRLDGRIHHVLQRQHGKTIHVHEPVLWHRNPKNSSNYSSPLDGYDELIQQFPGCIDVLL